MGVFFLALRGRNERDYWEEGGARGAHQRGSDGGEDV
jgi:hypothetical protein